MIARVELADVPSLVLATTGLVALVALVRRHRAGRPLLRPVDRPFRPARPGMLLLLAAGLFLVYSAVLGLVASSGHGLPVDAASIVVLLGAAVYAGILARRLVLLPRGSLAWRIGMGLLCLWAVFPVVLGTFRLSLLFGPEQPQVDVLRQRAEGWQWLALTALLVAPAVEEVCFRGLLYPALRQRLGARDAIVFSSLAFAFVHPPTVWLPLAILAAALAWLVETTGSVVPGIAAHMALNGLTVGTVLLSG